MPQSKPTGDSRLRLIPSVDQLLRTTTAAELTATLGVKKVTALARIITAELRSAIRNEEVQINQHSSESLLDRAEQRLRDTVAFEKSKWNQKGNQRHGSRFAHQPWPGPFVGVGPTGNW